MGGVMVVRALNIEDNVSKVVILIATRPIIQRDVGKLNLMKKIVFFTVVTKPVFQVLLLVLMFL